MPEALAAINRGGSEDFESNGYLPSGKYIRLAGRGRCFYREHANPGKPTLILLHGMLSSSGMNWFKCFALLSEHFHIIAPDLRGHGRSFRRSRSYRLTSCAKDIAKLIDTLQLKNVILVGYSMGGAVAQHVSHHYPQHVAGLVFSAIGYKQHKGPRNHFLTVPFFSVIVGATRLSELLLRLPNSIRRIWFPGTDLQEYQSRRQWLIDELRRTPLRTTIEAAREMAFHNAEDWLSEMRVPAAVLVTLRDRAIAPEHQLELAMRLPDAELFEIDLGHTAVANDEYPPALLESCLHVAARINSKATK